MYATLRHRIYLQLDPRARLEPGMSAANILMVAIILASILVAVLESERILAAGFPLFFYGCTWFFAVIFSLEYILRIWVMVESEECQGPLGRLRYMFTLASLTDLLVLAAIWFDLIAGIPGVYGVLLRFIRVIRVFALTHNSRIGIAIRLLNRALLERSTELILSFTLALMVLLAAATVLFLVEGDVQPEAFGSIPRAMWWAMATLTTVGYGDVYPVTAVGQICASVVAISSIAIVAMPTGIMAAAFSDAFQRLKKPHSRDYDI